MNIDNLPPIIKNKNNFFGTLTNIVVKLNSNPCIQAANMLIVCISAQKVQTRQILSDIANHIGKQF